MAVGALKRRDQENDFDAVLKIGGAQGVHAAQIEEEEFFGEGEVFLQQAIGGQRAVGVRDEAFVVGEADGAQSVGKELDGALAELGPGIAKQNRPAIVAEQLVEGVNQRRFTIEIEAKRIEGQGGETYGAERSGMPSTPCACRSR